LLTDRSWKDKPSSVSDLNAKRFEVGHVSIVPHTKRLPTGIAWWEGWLCGLSFGYFGRILGWSRPINRRRTS